MEKISQAKKTIYFRKLDDQDFNAIMHCLQGRVMSFKEGDYIAHMDDKATYAYLILAGDARSYSIDDDGNIFINLDYKKGNIFGLNDIIQGNKTYSEDLKALTDVDILALDSFRLINPTLNRCLRHIELLKACFKEIGRQNKELEIHKNLLTLSKTSDKVMLFLKNYSQRKKTLEFDIDYSRQELATYLGVERSALSAELSKLKKEKRIDYSLNHFILLEKE